MTQDQWDALLNEEPMNEELRNVYHDWLLEQGRDADAVVQRYLLDGKAWLYDDTRPYICSEQRWDLFVRDLTLWEYSCWEGCALLAIQSTHPNYDVDYCRKSKIEPGVLRISASSRSELEHCLGEALCAQRQS